jgi:hypothetical protein
MDEKRIARKDTRTDVSNNSVLDNLIDALFTEDFNNIITNYSNTEIDFHTIVLFIKLYMMAYKFTENEPNGLAMPTTIRKEKIKTLINFAIKDSFTRSQIVKSFNDGTIVKTFMEITDRKLK